MLYADKLIVSRAEPRALGRSCLPLIWAQIPAVWAQFEGSANKRQNLCFAAKEVENRAIAKKGWKPLPSSGRGAETGPTSAAYGQRSPLKCPKNYGHNKDTISVPMGVSERQKGPSEPSDYLGLRVSHSLSRHRLAQSLVKAISCE
jgi:hypothetical protein